MQGLVTGIAGAIGYGLGVIAAYVWRLFADRPERPARPPLLAGLHRRRGRRAAGLDRARPVLAVTSIRRPDGRRAARDPRLTSCLPVVVLADLRRAGRAGPVPALAVPTCSSGSSARSIGPRAARAVGWAAVVGRDRPGRQRRAARRVHERRQRSRSRCANDITQPGVTQPTTRPALRRPGLAGELGLARAARAGSFVGRARPSARSPRSPASPAKAPIRAYAGLESARHRGAAAALAVDDLARAGGFDRGQPAGVDHHRQRLGRPGQHRRVRVHDRRRHRDRRPCSTPTCRRGSPYLVDQKQGAGRPAGTCSTPSTSAGRTLPTGTGRRCSSPARASGRSAREAAFSGEFDLRNRTSGTLLTGPPNFNTLHREFTDGRDPGTPGVPARSTGTAGPSGSPTNATGIPPGDKPWNGTRVLYIQHASDPIVWWSPHLVFHQARLAEGDSAGRTCCRPFAGSRS